MKRLTRYEAQKLAAVLENAEMCTDSLECDANFRLTFSEDEKLIEVRMNESQISELKTLKENYLKQVISFYESIADEIQGVKNEEEN